MNDQFTIGVYCGTDSVRSIFVNTTNENEFAVSVFYYLSCKNGLYVNTSPKQFRQHLKDYIKGLKYTIKSVCSKLELKWQRLQDTFLLVQLVLPRWRSRN